MLKNGSARNQTKPVPLRPSRRPESGGIIFIANGVRMRKISRSVRKVKQANLMLTGQDTWHVRTVPRGRPYSADVADRTDDVEDRTEGQWRHQDAPRVTRIWRFEGTVGPIKK
jgi:hypothetical protein